MGDSAKGDRPVGEHSDFSEVNAYIYHSARNLFYDGVIWCLAPLIEDSRSFGRVRIIIATVTCTICRRVLRVED